MYLFCVRGNLAKGRMGELNFKVYSLCTTGSFSLGSSFFYCFFPLGVTGVASFLASAVLTTFFVFFAVAPSFFSDNALAVLFSVFLGVAFFVANEAIGNLNITWLPKMLAHAVPGRAPEVLLIVLKVLRR